MDQIQAIFLDLFYFNGRTIITFQVVLMDNVIVELMLRAETVTNAIVALLV